MDTIMVGLQNALPIGKQTSENECLIMDSYAKHVSNIVKSFGFTGDDEIEHIDTDGGLLLTRLWVRCTAAQALQGADMLHRLGGVLLVSVDGSSTPAKAKTLQTVWATFDNYAQVDLDDGEVHAIIACETVAQLELIMTTLEALQ